MAEPIITSVANPRLRAVAALRRRRARDAQGRTVVEGLAELELALGAGAIPELVLFCPELGAGAGQFALVERARGHGATALRCGAEAFERVAYREGPDGILAVLPTPGVRLCELTVPPEPLLVVCEALEKPGNLGAVLRTADAVGAAAVIATDPVADWGNPNVVRASKGTVFSVPVALGTVDETSVWLRHNGIRLVATTPDGSAAYTDTDLRGAVAIAVGTEKYGLSPAMLAAADARVRIPMVGRVNSLNAATAAAVVLYEAVRQRSH
jgi:RNA methyltransferase, TrmH family